MGCCDCVGCIHEVFLACQPSRSCGVRSSRRTHWLQILSWCQPHELVRKCWPSIGMFCSWLGYAHSPGLLLWLQRA